MKQSKEQAKANCRLQRWKQKRLLEMEKEYGEPWCERCKMWTTWVGPLQVHHERSRSLGRDDKPENLRLLCAACHDEQEDPARVAERKQEQIGMGGSAKLLPPRMAE